VFAKREPVDLYAIPPVFDTEKAAALYRDGLLEVRLTKRPLDRIHRVNIQSD